MYVVKRNGKQEQVHFDKITTRISRLCYRLNDFVDPCMVSQKVIQGVYKGVTTSELDELAAETSAHLTSLHPDFGVLAARISVSNLHKSTLKSFSETATLLYTYVEPKTGKKAPMIADDVYAFIQQHADTLNAAIVYDRDMGYDYFGFKTLQHSYLLKINGKVVERPQHMIMRVAVGIHCGNLDNVIETYNLMSLKWFTHATPTLFNAGTVCPQLSSCFLLSMFDDSIEGIYETLKASAMISKQAGGIGLSVHNIRACGSYIRGTNGTSNGLIPMLRVFNNTARYVDQGGGKRKGAFAIYLEPWHADILPFLDLKKNHGIEEDRARDLFYGLWVNDIFMRTIRCSNLCTEIIEYTSPEEVAVCNLASVALPMFVNNKVFDFQKLYEVTYVMTKNLNRVIDINYYPIPQAKYSNLKNRPIGIGCQGLADAFILMRFPFESAEAARLNKDIFETMYFAALTASKDLAIKDGHYDSYPGSPASKGLLQFDLWGVQPDSGRWDWAGLKAEIAKHGLRNSLLLAPMPTASTSQILGNNECFEPYTSNIYVRRTLAGEFVCVSRHLLQDLIELGIWTPALKDKIIAKNGSIKGISEIPQHIRDLYKTVWEVSQKTIINMAADRGVYIDQSQSLNIHMTDVTDAKLTSMHFHAWKKGLKTGMYYLRTKPSVDAQKFTISHETQKAVAEEEAQQRLMEAQAKAAKVAAAKKAAASATTAAEANAKVSMSGSVAYDVATSGMRKLAVGSPVKQAPNPRGEVSAAAATASTTPAYVLSPVDARSAEEIRAAREKAKQEVMEWQLSQLNQGSCTGGSCSA